MADRRKKLRQLPGLEPLEGREVRSGLMVALQANVGHLDANRVAQVASSRTIAPSLKASAAASTSANDVFVGSSGPNAGSNFGGPILLGQGTPTAAELARERFVARFSGPMAVQPGRFSDQSKIILLRGLGGSTPNFFLRGDYALAMVFPAGFDPKHPTGLDPANPKPVTGFAFLDDKNNNSGGTIGLDLVADPSSFDRKGRPTRFTFTSDPNIYSGLFYSSASNGVVTIKYGKSTASALFSGRIYTNGLTSGVFNSNLYNG